MTKRARQEGGTPQHHDRRHDYPPVSPWPHKHRDPEDDPVARYVDWTEHRYTPGYFVGGRLHPLVRELQNAGPAGRMYGSVLIGVGLLEILTLIAYRSSLRDTTSLWWDCRRACTCGMPRIHPSRSQIVILKRWRQHRSVENMKSPAFLVRRCHI